MPQVVLDRTQIMPLVGQCVPAGVAKHVGMDLAKIGSLTDTTDQVVNALPRKLPPRSVTNNQGNREFLIRR